MGNTFLNMSDGIHKMWDLFEDYKDLCAKLKVNYLDINEEWFDHYNKLRNG